jgi:hypothetical protein
MAEGWGEPEYIRQSGELQWTEYQRLRRAADDQDRRLDAIDYQKSLARRSPQAEDLGLRLRALKAMRDSNLITDEEYRTTKARILSTL